MIKTYSSEAIDPRPAAIRESITREDVEKTINKLLAQQDKKFTVDYPSIDGMTCWICKAPCTHETSVLATAVKKHESGRELHTIMRIHKTCYAMQLFDTPNLFYIPGVS